MGEGKAAKIARGSAAAVFFDGANGEIGGGGPVFFGDGGGGEGGEIARVGADVGEGEGKRVGLVGQIGFLQDGDGGAKEAGAVGEFDFFFADVAGEGEELIFGPFAGEQVVEAGHDGLGRVVGILGFEKAPESFGVGGIFWEELFEKCAGRIVELSERGGGVGERVLALIGAGFGIDDGGPGAQAGFGGEIDGLAEGGGGFFFFAEDVPDAGGAAEKNHLGFFGVCRELQGFVVALLGEEKIESGGGGLIAAGEQVDGFFGMIVEKQRLGFGPGIVIGGGKAG